MTDGIGTSFESNLWHPNSDTTGDVACTTNVNECSYNDLENTDDDDDGPLQRDIVVPENTMSLNTWHGNNIYYQGKIRTTCTVPSAGGGHCGADIDNFRANIFYNANYTSYEDQVTLAGDIYTDAMFNSFTNNNKRVMQFAIMPTELQNGDNTPAYFFPNFIPRYGTAGNVISASAGGALLAADYCGAMGKNTAQCNASANFRLYRIIG